MEPGGDHSVKPKQTTLGHEMRSHEAFLTSTVQYQGISKRGSVAIKWNGTRQSMASRTFNVTLHDGVDPNRPQMASSRPLSDLRVRPLYSSDHLAVKSRANPQIKRQRTWLRSSNIPFPCAVLWVLCLEFSTIVEKGIHPACRSGVVLF